MLPYFWGWGSFVLLKMDCVRVARGGSLSMLHRNHYLVWPHHIYSFVFLHITFILLSLYTSHLFYCDCAHQHFLLWLCTLTFSIVIVHITFILLCLCTSHLFHCTCENHTCSVLVHITFILLFLSTLYLFHCVGAHHIYSIVYVHITFILLCLCVFFCAFTHVFLHITFF